MGIPLPGLCPIAIRWRKALMHFGYLVKRSAILPDAAEQEKIVEQAVCRLRDLWRQTMEKHPDWIRTGEPGVLEVLARVQDVVIGYRENVQTEGQFWLLENHEQVNREVEALAVEIANAVCTADGRAFKDYCFEQNVLDYEDWLESLPNHDGDTSLDAWIEACEGSLFDEEQDHVEQTTTFGNSDDLAAENTEQTEWLRSEILCPTTDTLEAAKQQSRFVFYFVQTIPAAIECTNIDERDRILQRCVDSLRSAVKVDEIANHCVRFDATERGCPVAKIATVIDAEIRKLLHQVDLFGPAALLLEPKEIFQLRDECVRMANELSQRQMPGQLELEPAWDWIENSLDPTPGSLLRFADHLRKLADAIDCYESELAGKPMDVVAIEADVERATLFELLERLRRVSDWDSGEGSIADGPESLDIEWEGWLDQWGLMFDWQETLPKLVWRLIETLRSMGIPYDPPACFVGLVFKDVCLVENEFTSDCGRLCLREAPITDVGEIKAKSKFVSLDNVEDLVESSLYDGEIKPTLQSSLRTIAPQIERVVQKKGTRTVEGQREFRIDLTRILRFAGNDDQKPAKGYYPESTLQQDPFELALELEGMTGVTLESGSDPVWLLEQYERYKKAIEEFGPQSKFPEYLSRKFPRLRVNDSGYCFQTNEADDLTTYDYFDFERSGLGSLDIPMPDRLGQEARTHEILPVDDEVPQVRSVVYKQADEVEIGKNAFTEHELQTKPNNSSESAANDVELSKRFEQETKVFSESQWSEKIKRNVKAKAKMGRGRHVQSFFIEGAGGIYYGDKRTFVFKGDENNGYYSLKESHSERIGKKIANEFGLHRRIQRK